MGIMSAKTFAFATGCKLISVDTFLAVAWQAPPEAFPLDVVADAQRDLLYVQSFQMTPQGPNARSPLEIKAASTWERERLSESWVSGPGLGKLAERNSELARAVPVACWHPLPESLVTIGWSKYQAAQFDDPLALEPLYLRPSAAEEKQAESPP